MMNLLDLTMRNHHTLNFLKVDLIRESDLIAIHESLGNQINIALCFTT
jgi:hypothetical protein